MSVRSVGQCLLKQGRVAKAGPDVLLEGPEVFFELLGWLFHIVRSELTKTLKGSLIDTLCHLNYNKRLSLPMA